MNGQVQAGTGSASRTWFLYAGGQLVSEFTDAASNTYSSPTSPGGAGSDDYATMLYQHADHLTTRVTTDNSGESGSAQAHYPYGENWYNTGGADPSVKRKFTSYRKETDSSLASGQINYAIARYHGARIGRFIRPEPRSSGGTSGSNGYSFGPNDPVNRPTPDAPPKVDDGPVTPVVPGSGIPPSCAANAICTFAYLQCQVTGCKGSEFIDWATFGPYASWVWGLGQSSGGYTFPNTLGGGGSGGGVSVGFGIEFGLPWWWFGALPSGRCTAKTYTRLAEGVASLCNKGDVFIMEWMCDGDEGCCINKRSEFLHWCENLPKLPNSPLEYSYVIDQNWWMRSHCCGHLKRR